MLRRTLILIALALIPMVAGPASIATGARPATTPERTTMRSAALASRPADARYVFDRAPKRWVCTSTRNSRFALAVGGDETQGQGIFFARQGRGWRAFFYNATPPGMTAAVESELRRQGGPRCRR